MLNERELLTGQHDDATGQPHQHHDHNDPRDELAAVRMRLQVPLVKDAGVQVAAAVRMDVRHGWLLHDVVHDVREPPVTATFVIKLERWIHILLDGLNRKS